MEKTARRNIMEIYEIFRKIIKRDLALDRTSGRWRMTLSGQRSDTAWRFDRRSSGAVGV